MDPATRAKLRCAYCRCTLVWDDPNSEHYATKDHKVPRAKGGKHGRNVTLACRRCNDEKGDMSVAEFREYLDVTAGSPGRRARQLAWQAHIDAKANP